MCSHPEHQVEVLPDGQIDETHVLSDEDMERLFNLTSRWLTITPGEVYVNGKPWTDAEGE